MRQPNRLKVLGGDIGGTRHRHDGRVPWRLGHTTGENQRLLQRAVVGEVRPEVRDARPGTRDHGLDTLGPTRSTVPSRQLRVRSERRQQQLGEGPLHGRGRAGGVNLGRGEEGERELRVSPGLPAGPLVGRGNGLGPRHTPHVQDPRGVSGQNTEHVQCDAFSKGLLSFNSLFVCVRLCLFERNGTGISVTIP